jgi:pyruvate kinase
MSENNASGNVSGTESSPKNLLQSLLKLRSEIVKQSDEILAGWEPGIHRANFLPSARNLATYLALRQHDLRTTQAQLVPWGLSSLGRSEAHVLASLDAVIASLGAIAGDYEHNLPDRPSDADFLTAERTIARNTEELFGKYPRPRHVRVMVTLPPDASQDADLVERMLAAGTDTFRINCAHDNPEAWQAMIANVRRAEKALGRDCKIHMDLGGPKARTGRILTPHPGDRVHIDDKIFLHDGTGKPSEKKSMFLISCQLPEVLPQLVYGAEVWIEDGKIGTRVEETKPNGVLLRVTHAAARGAKLKPDKGLNFPKTTIRLPSLTEKDREDLKFVVKHADTIGYSFVQEVSDIEALAEVFNTLEATNQRVILKIETQRAVENMPSLIVRAASEWPTGVMIARGDLAVELGFERIAEMQEELLWVAEAAHIPVVWATQVLENLIQKGMPTRAEITDAAMGERAECVMLNKGPFIIEGIETLNNVLHRMRSHQRKKTPQLRALHTWKQANLILV